LGGVLPVVLTKFITIMCMDTIGTELKLNLERLTTESECRFAEESAELSRPAYVGAEQGSNLEGKHLSSGK
jgi:hypothetical protein